MPLAQPKTAIREPKRAQRARARATRYYQRTQQAKTPHDRHSIATDYLLATVRNSRTSTKDAQRLTRDYSDDVRQLVSHTSITEPRARKLYLDPLDQPADTAQKKLARVLKLLLHLVTELDDDPSEVHEHYAGQLTHEARRLDGNHLQTRS